MAQATTPKLLEFKVSLLYNRLEASLSYVRLSPKTTTAATTKWQVIEPGVKEPNVPFEKAVRLFHCFASSTGTRSWGGPGQLPSFQDGVSSCL